MWSLQLWLSLGLEAATEGHWNFSSGSRQEKLHSRNCKCTSWISFRQNRACSCHANPSACSLTRWGHHPVVQWFASGAASHWPEPCRWGGRDLEGVMFWDGMDGLFNNRGCCFPVPSQLLGSCALGYSRFHQTTRHSPKTIDCPRPPTNRHHEGSRCASLARFRRRRRCPGGPRAPPVRCASPRAVNSTSQ
jgi:hypothetical protein